LLGDSPGDAHMVDDNNADVVLRVWFLNHDTPENRTLFGGLFDLLILNDGPMDQVNEIIGKILSQELT
jgi:hypothetical protein